MKPITLRTIFEVMQKQHVEIKTQLNKIEKKQDKLMKSQADLDAEIDAETATIADVATRVAADLKKLQDLIAAGTPPADLQAQFDKIDKNIATLKGVDPAVVVAAAPGA